MRAATDGRFFAGRWKHGLGPLTRLTGHPFPPSASRRSLASLPKNLACIRVVPVPLTTTLPSDWTCHSHEPSRSTTTTSRRRGLSAIRAVCDRIPCLSPTPRTKALGAFRSKQTSQPDARRLENPSPLGKAPQAARRRERLGNGWGSERDICPTPSGFPGRKSAESIGDADHPLGSVVVLNCVA